MLDGLDGCGLRSVSTRSELADRANAFAESIGSKHFSYMLLRAPKGMIAGNERAISDCPDEWISRYVERNHMFHDPLVRLVGQSRLPFAWGYRGFDARLSKAERLVMHEARTFGIMEGYAVPVAGPEGDVGGVNFCVERPGAAAEIAAESAARIQLFAAEFHAAAIRILVGDDPHPVDDLTAREREVLSWAAEGFSSEATAERIGLTSATVNYHIARTCRKLGAANKIQAVALALRRALI